MTSHSPMIISLAILMCFLNKSNKINELESCIISNGKQGFVWKWWKVLTPAPSGAMGAVQDENRGRFATSSDGPSLSHPDLGVFPWSRSMEAASFRLPRLRSAMAKDTSKHQRERREVRAAGSPLRPYGVSGDGEALSDQASQWTHTKATVRGWRWTFRGFTPDRWQGQSIKAGLDTGVWSTLLRWQGLGLGEL